MSSHPTYSTQDTLTPPQPKLQLKQSQRPSTSTEWPRPSTPRGRFLTGEGCCTVFDSKVVIEVDCSTCGVIALVIAVTSVVILGILSSEVSVANGRWCHWGRLSRSCRGCQDGPC
ncbi:hypothetical protein BJY04DRAFT_80831 [Aspergillus karnatakaensis]|uniref:uncharacterized protein n=1 Tax=Aspergillus karnatakaensis TaxID=1810916 RepID=UPI003CCE0C85